MTLQRRATFPLELPCNTMSRLLRGYLTGIEIEDRIERLEKERVPLVEGEWLRKRKRGDIRISASRNKSNVK